MGFIFSTATLLALFHLIKGFVQSTTAVSMRHCNVIFAMSFLQHHFCNVIFAASLLQHHFCNVILIRRIILIFRFGQKHRHTPHSCPWADSNKDEMRVFKNSFSLKRYFK